MTQLKDTFSDFKTCYKETLIKTVWYWHRQAYRPNGIAQNPEIKPRVYGHMIFYKDAKTIKWEKGWSFQ